MNNIGFNIEELFMDSRVIKNRGHLKTQIRERYDNSNLGSPDGLEEIGNGFNRTVYRVTDDTYGQEVEGMVIKVQHPDSYENRTGREVWRRYKGQDLKNISFLSRTIHRAMNGF